MLKTTLLKFTVALLFISTVTVVAQTPEEKGLQIAIESDKRDVGFGDSQSELKMILRNKQGDESTRQMSNKTLEVNGDGDKSLVIFNEPRDVKGTAFLSFTHKSGPDDQWLYLPALKRVKRIASDNKSGPFMGSEFAYEDISSQEVEKYTYKYIKDEKMNSMDCYLVERYPVDKSSGYTRQEVWYDREHYRPMKVVFYDRKNSKLKTFNYESYKQYLNKYWRADKLLMEN
ncbi:MAG: outer membrane lipoprotein-sorting protein, partial [Ignavibacteria bacterium]|nr:outer membrane lipoprotein-sorting protein [Ignavibacteria bacterium]